MLKKLLLQNIGVIEEASIDFSPQFNIITGETGTGKSILLGAVQMLTGKIATKSLFDWNLHSSAKVSGIIKIADKNATKEVIELGGTIENNELIVNKSITASTTNQSLAGVPVPLSTLSRILTNKIVIHGQSEQLKLKDSTQQRKIIDKYLSTDLEKYQSTYFELKNKQSELEKLKEQNKNKEFVIDGLKKQIKEIDEIYVNGKTPTQEDYDGLKNKIENSSNSKDVIDAVNSAVDSLSNDNVENDTISNINRAISALKTVDNSDTENIIKALESSLAELNVATNDLINLKTKIDVGLSNTETLEVLQNRLSIFNNLFSKYGKTVDDIVKWKDNAEKELETLENFDERIKNIEDEISEKENEAKEQARNLYEKRQEIAKNITSDTMNILPDLGLKNAKFKIEISKIDALTPTGFDNIEILFTANSGFALKPLSKAISGGELSRVMLALELVLAKNNENIYDTTFIFDEVDAGIGGTSAFSVGKALKELSKHYQIIVVTHLAQIASMADNHLIVDKFDDGIQAKTTIKTVDGNNRILEIARMIGGNLRTAVEHAKELLNQ